MYANYTYSDCIFILVETQAEPFAKILFSLHNAFIGFWIFVLFFDLFHLANYIFLIF